MRARTSWARPRLFESPEAKEAFKRARARRAEQLIDFGCNLDRAARQQVLSELKDKVSTHFFTIFILMRML